MAYNSRNILRLRPYHFPAKWLNVLHEAERKLVNLLLEVTKLVQQELENKFYIDLITNFPQNYTDIKNDIIVET